MSENAGPPSPPEANATPGCFILGAIITVFGGLIVLYTVICFVQDKAFSGFTSESATQVQLLEPSDGQIAQLKEKLAAITTATSENKSERILLTRDDINTMIATIDILKDFRGTTFVEAINDRGMETRMTRPLKKLPLTKGRRHLNGKYIFYPELRKRTIALRVLDIISEKGSVPEEFVKNYDTIGFFKLDPENPNIKPLIPKLSRVYLEGNAIAIETGSPADDQSSLPK